MWFSYEKTKFVSSQEIILKWYKKSKKKFENIPNYNFKSLNFNKWIKKMVFIIFSESLCI